MAQTTVSKPACSPSNSDKLFGRAFYESIGSPKMIIAPMVDRSEFAWRMLTRSYLDQERSKSLLAYTPMLHARLFKEKPKFRDLHFQPTRESLTSIEKSTSEPWLDGNPKIDRPLFVQFCANQPDDLFEAAQYVAPYCDAVDLNLGCPQGIARSGHYGAFLQEDWDTIYKLINKLHKELPVPITAKMRILDTKEKTLDYAKMILSAGASILTVHGRRREQKGHMMGVADWQMIRYLRDNLPPETVLFANGNILNSGDLQQCLEATGADGVMSAEGNLSDPTIFAGPPMDPGSPEYWKGLDGKGGYRLDGVFRRYMDIIYRHVLDQDPPSRQPLYTSAQSGVACEKENDLAESADEPPNKKQKKDKAFVHDPNLKALQGHLFQLLRPMLSSHTDIRDTLARTRPGDMQSFEKVLSMVESVVKRGIQEYTTKQHSTINDVRPDEEESHTEMTDSQKTIETYGRPWWVCQPHIRPSPEDAIKSGAHMLSKKDKAIRDLEGKKEDVRGFRLTEEHDEVSREVEGTQRRELPQPALVCG